MFIGTELAWKFSPFWVQMGGRKASLIVSDASTGESRSFRLPHGYDDESVVAVQVDLDGRCLIRAKKKDGFDQFEVVIFRRSGIDEEVYLFEEDPQFSIYADGFLVSGIENPLARTITCAGTADNISLVFTDRIMSTLGKSNTN